jgi:hypothetical protein
LGFLCSCQQQSHLAGQRTELRIQKSGDCNDLFEIVLYVENSSDDTILIANSKRIDIYTKQKGIKASLPFIFALDDPCLSQILFSTVRPPNPDDYLRDSLMLSFYHKCYVDNVIRKNDELSKNPKFYDAVLEHIRLGDGPIFSPATDLVVLSPANDTIINIGYVEDIAEFDNLYWRANPNNLSQQWVHDYINIEGESIRYIRPLGFDLTECFDFYKYYITGEDNGLILK